MGYGSDMDVYTGEDPEGSGVGVVGWNGQGEIKFRIVCGHYGTSVFHFRRWRNSSGGPLHLSFNQGTRSFILLFEWIGLFIITNSP